MIIKAKISVDKFKKSAQSKGRKGISMNDDTTVVLATSDKSDQGS